MRAVAAAWRCLALTACRLLGACGLTLLLARTDPGRVDRRTRGDVVCRVSAPQGRFGLYLVALRSGCAVTRSTGLGCLGCALRPAPPSPPVRRVLRRGCVAAAPPRLAVRVSSRHAILLRAVARAAPASASPARLGAADLSPRLLSRARPSSAWAALSSGFARVPRSARSVRPAARRCRARRLWRRVRWLRVVRSPLAAPVLLCVQFSPARPYARDFISRGPPDRLPHRRHSSHVLLVVPRYLAPFLARSFAHAVCGVRLSCVSFRCIRRVTPHASSVLRRLDRADDPPLCEPHLRPAASPTVPHSALSRRSPCAARLAFVHAASPHHSPPSARPPTIALAARTSLHRTSAVSVSSHRLAHRARRSPSISTTPHRTALNSASQRTTHHAATRHKRFITRIFLAIHAQRLTAILFRTLTACSRSTANPAFTLTTPTATFASHHNTRQQPRTAAAILKPAPPPHTHLFFHTA